MQVNYLGSKKFHLWLTNDIFCRGEIILKYEADGKPRYMLYVPNKLLKKARGAPVTTLKGAKLTKQCMILPSKNPQLDVFTIVPEIFR